MGLPLLLAFSCGPADVPDRAPTSTEPGEMMVVDRLFFGREIRGGGTVAEGEWAAFLDEVVTPRFPKGLTAWGAEGRWTDPAGRLVREPVFVAEIVHPEGARADTSLEQIAGEYCRRFRQDSVLRATTPARLRLYEVARPRHDRPGRDTGPPAVIRSPDPAIPDRPATRGRPRPRIQPVET